MYLLKETVPVKESALSQVRVELCGASAANNTATGNSYRYPYGMGPTAEPNREYQALRLKG